MKSIVESALRRVGERCGIPFAVRFAGGGEYRNSSAAPEFTLVFRKSAAYRRIALYGHIGLLEAYFDGDLDIEGSVVRCMAAGMQGGMDQPKPLVKVRNWWHEFRNSNKVWRQAKSNAEFHYALGPEFYRLWLDEPLMLYTCAYWKEGTRTLEEAQRNKCDHVARKLLLAPGEEVVDIGSGFGGFLFHAYERFGVRVTGVNATDSQADMVRSEIERRQLGTALQVVSDMRDARREFDKVVSIGVLEHSGRDQLAEVIQAHARFLKTGGLGLLHFIGHVGHFETEYFIREHVFPGGWIPSLADVVVEMEKAGLEVLDVENLRRHYALTLDAWAERFERNWPRIQALDPKRFDERFRRVWMIYLHGCAEMFRSPTGHTHLFQVVFSKGNVTMESYPMGREFLYREPAAPHAAFAAQPPQHEKRSAGRAA